MIILIKYIILSLGSDFLFEFFKNYLVILFTAIINSLFHVVLTRNNLNQLIHLIRKLQSKLIINLKINKYYHLKDFEKIYNLTLKLFK